jgi:hypothetical protein
MKPDPDGSQVAPASRPSRFSILSVERSTEGLRCEAKRLAGDSSRGDSLIIAESGQPVTILDVTQLEPPGAHSELVAVTLPEGVNIEPGMKTSYFVLL